MIHGLSAIPEKHCTPRKYLESYGVTPDETAELTRLGMITPRCGPAKLNTFPLESEAFATVWKEYTAEARVHGTFNTLQKHLVQLQFPISQGISETPAYRNATRRGIFPGRDKSGGSALRYPGALRLFIHPSIAGEIPVLNTPDRHDFVALIQAFGNRNEPAPVPASMGAAIISGYTNWDRVRRYREAWERSHTADWSEGFRRLKKNKALYQDCFIILCDGPYSGVPAAELGLADETWNKLSFTIRLEHECTHYFTKRVLGACADMIYDELVADYVGITAANGTFRSDWLLRFMGLEGYPAYRTGGRLENYRGDPPMSAGAFRVVQALVHDAAEHLERYDREVPFSEGNVVQRGQKLVNLYTKTLPELAATEP